MIVRTIIQPVKENIEPDRLLREDSEPKVECTSAKATSPVKCKSVFKGTKTKLEKANLLKRQKKRKGKTKPNKGRKRQLQMDDHKELASSNDECDRQLLCCTHCDFRYRTGRFLRRHIKRKHIKDNSLVEI